MVNHVSVLISKGLTAGLLVRLVGKYAIRIFLSENAVSGRNLFQSGRAVWTSNFIADDDTPRKN